jgi:hypothetical protein
MASAEAEANRKEQLRRAETAQKKMNVAIVKTFAKRAREAALTTRAKLRAAEAGATTAAADAETSFAENAMQE